MQHRERLGQLLQVAPDLQAAADVGAYSQLGTGAG